MIFKITITIRLFFFYCPSMISILTSNPPRYPPSASAMSWHRARISSSSTRGLSDFEW